MRTKRLSRTTRLQPTTAELKDRLNLSIEEARRLTGYSRPAVLRKCNEGDWQWFYEGKRVRIVTQSIIEYQLRRSLDPRKATLKAS